MKSATIKLFKLGRSQAVRLPKEFRLPGTEVRVRRLGRGVLLEPMERSLGDIQHPRIAFYFPASELFLTVN